MFTIYISSSAASSSNPTFNPTPYVPAASNAINSASQERAQLTLGHIIAKLMWAAFQTLLFQNPSQLIHPNQHQVIFGGYEWFSSVFGVQSRWDASVRAEEPSRRLRNALSREDCLRSRQRQRVSRKLFPSQNSRLDVVNGIIAIYCKECVWFKKKERFI